MRRRSRDGVPINRLAAWINLATADMDVPGSCLMVRSNTSDSSGFPYKARMLVITPIVKILSPERFFLSNGLIESNSILAKETRVSR